MHITDKANDLIWSLKSRSLHALTKRTFMQISSYMLPHCQILITSSGYLLWSYWLMHLTNGRDTSKENVNIITPCVCIPHPTTQTKQMKQKKKNKQNSFYSKAAKILGEILFLLKAVSSIVKECGIWIYKVIKSQKVDQALHVLGFYSTRNRVWETESCKSEADERGVFLSCA